MQFLARLFVAEPWHILAVAALFVAIHLGLRAAAPAHRGRHRPTLVAAGAWAAYAAWEALVQAQTPEADIRVDLLVIWPLLALISGWALFRVLRPARG